MFKYLLLIFGCLPAILFSKPTIPSTTMTVTTLPFVQNLTTTTPYITTTTSAPVTTLVPTNLSDVLETDNSNFIQTPTFQIILDLFPTLSLTLFSTFSFLIFKTQFSFIFYKFKIKFLSLGIALFFLFLIPNFVLYSLYTQDDIISLTGKLATMFFCLTLVSISKTNIWTYVFNLSPERATFFHLIFAFLTVVLSIVHTAFCISYTQSWNILIQQVTDNGISPLNGTISLSCILLTGILSFLRRKYWAFFLHTHRLFIIASYITLFIHFNGQLYYLMLLPTLLIITDIIWVIYNKSKSSTIIEFELDKYTTLLKVQPYRKLYTKFGPGSYYYVTMPTISNTAHPFSVISGPDDEKLTFVVKKMDYGSWTHKLFYTLEQSYEKEHDYENSLLFINENIKTLKCNIPVYISGPFGSLTINLQKTNLLLLFCNGIGVTPILSTAKFFLQDKNKNALLVWIGRQSNYIIKKEINALLETYSNIEIQIYDNSKPAISSIYNKVIVKNNSYKGKISAMVCGSSSLTKEIEDFSEQQNIPCHKETFLL
jgi:ferredoxin-NADP reductase